MQNGSAMTPLSQSLDLVAREVVDLVRLGDQLQALISRLVNAGGLPDLETLVEAQAADLLSQRLEGLAAFVRCLAEAAPRDVGADVEAAVRVLTLTEQARRLSAPSPSPAPVTASEDAGDLMMF